MSKEIINEGKNFDLEKYILQIWNYRLWIAVSIFLWLSAGVVFVLVRQKEFVANCIILPQTNQTKPNLGNLRGLASLAGITTGSSSSSDIPVTLYPQIVASTPFKMALLETSIKVQSLNSQVTFKDYYLNYYKPSPLGYIAKYSIGLPELMMDFVKDLRRRKNNFADSSITLTDSKKTLHRLTLEEKQLLRIIDTQLILEIDDRNGNVSISFSMPDPIAAGQMAQKTQDLLQEFIMDFKTKKATEELEFLRKQYEEAKQKYDLVQMELAKFKDQNVVISTATAETQLQRLQNEFNLQADIFNQLSTGLETQRMEVAKSAPSFTIIQPVLIPTNAEGVSKFLIVFITFFMGFTTPLLIVNLKEETISALKRLKVITQRGEIHCDDGDSSNE